MSFQNHIERPVEVFPIREKSYLPYLKTVGKTGTLLNNNPFQYPDTHRSESSESPLVPWSRECDLCLIRDLGKTDM